MGERHTRQNTFAGGTPRYHGSTQGGTASVDFHHTISAGGCWCGLPMGHDWPGRDEGKPHPREGATMTMATSEPLRIDVQRQMKRYPKAVRELVREIVNDYGVRWKVIDGQHMLLYPPDGRSRPFKIAGDRKEDDQVRLLENQFIKKYLPEWRSERRPRVVATDTPFEVPEAEEPPVLDAHATIETADTTTIVIDGKEYMTEPITGEGVAGQLITEVKPEVEVGTDWEPHYTAKEGAPTPFLKRLTEEGVIQFWCQRCAQEGKQFYTTNNRALGPHSGNHKEHKEKAVQTAKENRQKVADAVALIADLLGVEIATKQKWSDERVAALVAEHEKERDRLAAERDEALEMAAELENQLAKIKAAFS